MPCSLLHPLVVPQARHRLSSRLVVVALWALAVPNQAAAQGTPLEEMAWLSGCWMAGSGANTTEEVWLPPRGGMMVGLTRSVRRGTATGYELMVLQRADEQIVLTAYPSGQQPTDFQATSARGDLLRVENPDHDFPQRIEYHRPTPDSLVARVFGGVEDDAPAFNVRYVRVSCPPQPD
ncbi:MAG: DUF6265 family protein [Bacteroidota bacterium]